MQAMRNIFGVQSSSDFHDHGLRLLVPDPNDVAELPERRTTDIVFIHGLTGTWDGTWTGETSDGQKVLWPKELLKGRFPTARIFSFSYDANAVNLAHRVSTQSITQHANDLLIELETVRRETGTLHYNIVFVVHSLGGLVVQKMLSLSRNSHEVYYQRIESLTTGVVFFGTPMLGADLAAWASIGTALSSVLKQTNRDIVGILEPNSSMAESIRLDIANLVATRAHSGNPIKIACFYECLPVPGYGKVVVNDKSATWPPHYQKGIQADHMNMTKFASAQARGYRDFIGEVGRWIDKDICEEGQPSDILNRLDFAERTTRQQQIDYADALESTLDWIWSKEHQSRSSFAQWLLNEQAVFWIQGKPGSGKSTLMSYIEKASQSWQNKSASDSQWSVIRFFFDFRAQNGLANNLEGFLRSLLLQILKQNSSSEKELRHFEAKFGSYKAGLWAISTLKEALINVLLQASVNLCLLVDGLDEFSGNMHELMMFFYKTPFRTKKGHLVKICLASRPHPVIASVLGDCPGLRMQDHNIEAIRKYAITTMTNLGVAAHEKQSLMQFSTDIAEKAEGVFLWARFAVKEVIDGYAEGEDINELNQRLEALPSDMEELYARIFERMNTRDREEAQVMFQLVCFAQYDRGINVRQLQEAVAIAQDDNSKFGPHISVQELEMFRKRLNAKSGGLLEEIFYQKHFEAQDDDGSDDDGDGDGDGKEIDLQTGSTYGEWLLESVRRSKNAVREHFKKNGGMIKLIHRTADSYLSREGWFLGLSSLQITSPHALWLHVCCKSIKSRLQPHESRLQHAQPAKLEIDESTKSSLFEYASRNLFVHARLLESQSQTSSLSILETVSPTLWRYLRKQYRRDLGWDYVKISCRFNWDAVDERSDRQPWQIIVEQGLPLCLRDAVLKHYYTPPANGEDISLGIIHASNFYKFPEAVLKREPLIQLLNYLVRYGAIVSERHVIECLHYDNADVLATLLASWPMERIRLKRHPSYLTNVPLDVRSNDEENCTYNGESVGILWEFTRAKYTYRSQDYTAMFVLLLERGESLNEICGPGGTVLHACIIRLFRCNDDARPIEWILSHGANPNVSGPRGTPLQLAWRMFRSIPVAGLEWINYYSFQRAMSLLLEYAACSSWVEPNGISIDRRTLQAWCAMSYDEIKARWEDYDYPYCISNWYTYEFPLYHSARKSSETHHSGARSRTPPNQLEDERKGSSSGQYI